MGLNVLGIIVASVASFVVGMLWYGPLFGKTWASLSGIKMAKTMTSAMKQKAMKSMSLGFVIGLLMAYVVSNFVVLLNVTNAASAFQLALWAWLGFMVPIIMGAYLWENKSFKLVVLNGAYWLVSLFVMTLVLALWH